MERISRIRAAIVMLILALGMGGLIGRVAYLQTVGRRLSLARAQRQEFQREPLLARRGSIFDRNGDALALTVQTRDLFVDAQFLQDQSKSLVEMDDNVAKLAKLLDRDPFQISKMIGDQPDARFLKLAENLDESTCRAVSALNIPGVGFVPAPVRYYPMGSTAAHLLGGIRKDGVGLEGLELKFQNILAGKDGWEKVMKDARRHPIAVPAEDYVPPQHGQHLVLTIDANLQMIAEQELESACQQFKAQRGEVIVMDPRNGEVLALCNWPTFNPQNLDDSTPDVRRDRCLTDPYEPGSTIKPFILGPALQWNITQLSEMWPIPGITYRTPYGRTITDVHHYGPLCTWDGLVKSSNILMSMLGERMGNPHLRQALIGFGFGHRTGIELPGENPGKVNALAKWNKYSTESISQGYEVMVTPMQIARAFCVYANGGRLVQPHLLKGVLDPDGHVVCRQPVPDFDSLPEVLTPQEAAEMRRVMCDVVIRGTATGARSKCWNIFGKTGTAHVSQGRAGYSDSKFTSSFIAGAPYENPCLVVAFIVHEPVRSLGHYGGTVSAPAAKRLLERALAYLQVPPSSELPPPPPQVMRALFDYNPAQYTNHAVLSAAE